MTEHLFVPDAPVGGYTVTVSALRGELEGPVSAPLSVSVGAAECTAVPGAPTRVRHVVNPGGRLILMWFPPADTTAVTDYELQVTGSWTGSLVQPERDIVTLLPRGTYHVAIRARNACGVSLPSAVRTIVVP